MIDMSASRICVSATILATSLLVAATMAMAASIDDEYSGQVVEPPKIPSWGAYMRFFNKQYSSMSQLILRHKLFLVQAMESFITKTKYKLGQLNYFTEINKFSDLTSEEGQRIMSGNMDPALGEARLVMDDEAEVLLREIIAQQKAGQHARRRRSTGIMLNPNYRPPRLTNRLVESQSGSHGYEKQVEDIPPEKAPELERALQQHQQSLSTKVPGLVDMIKKGVSWLAPAHQDDEEDDEDDYESDDEEDNEDEDDDNDDEQEQPKKNLIILKDWRESGCVGPVVDQGACESCYAMTTTNFMEWSLCQSRDDKTFTKLSAQYLVSCGLQFSEESDNKYRFAGCEGGTTYHSFEFFKNYGLLPEEHMPYEEKVNECPVKAGTSIEQRGYYKPQINKVIRLSRTTTKLDLALEAGPVVVTMWEPRYFLAYGGGVVADCEKRGGHATLIIGTAVQDGEEYLLIKNSFGPYWGEEGYYKFQRSSIEKCVKEFIVPRVTFTAGS